MHHTDTRRKAYIGSLKHTLKTYKGSPDLLYKVAVDLYEALDTPVSLTCEILLRYKEYEQLLTKTVNPGDYLDAETFGRAAQAAAFLRKVPIKAPGIDPEAKAKGSFFVAEEMCRVTNSRFRSFLDHPERVDPEVRAVIVTAASEIEKIIGTTVDYREWLYACRFGPGVFNHNEAKGLTSLYDKLQVRPSVSYEADELGAVLVMSSPAWARSITGIETEGFHPFVRSSDLDRVPGNRVAFVPKTAITHRTIAIEPLLNIYAQLGIGKMLRRKLLRNVGLDLSDQTPNQEMARIGSVDGSLATVDLSMASDTLAREVVRFFLPDKWFEACDTIRSKVGLIDKKWIRYEKFSSMGNGFTFELETLIFLGLSLACVRHLRLDPSQVRVYGDDIIIPVDAYGLLEKVLTFCGFKVNSLKSFKAGPFRESCGKDWFMGHDVRPFFQKEYLNEIQHLFRLANGLRMLAYRRNNFNSCDVRLHKPWLTVVRAIPRSISQFLRVPSHAGDSDGIKSNWDEAQISPAVTKKWQWDGYFGARYQARPVRVLHPTNMLGVIAEMLYRLRDGRTVEASVSSPPRLGRDHKYELNTRAYYGPWTDFGDWR